MEVVLIKEPENGTGDAEKEVARLNRERRRLHPSPHVAKKKTRNPSTIALVGLFALGLVAFLHFARAFFLPIVLAGMLNFFFKPVVKWLARFKLPQTVGAALVLLLMLVAIGNGITHLAAPANDLITKLPESLHRLQQKGRLWLRHAAQLSQAAAEVQDLTKGNPAGKPVQEVKVVPNSLGGIALSATTSFLGGAVETGVLLYFFLAYGEIFLQKLVKVLPSFHEKKKAATITHEVQQHISTFLFTITVINAVLGVLLGFGVWVVGLKNPVLWGVAAALLNFIPYFGPVIGVSILTLAGLLTFDSVGYGLVPPMIYLGLHLTEANFVTPMILGRRLTLNPVVIFVSFMFWTWLWGIPGALLSVPLLMTVKLLCDHFKPLEPIGEFISG